MDKEMMRALEADGEKLRQLTGEDHGPIFVPECEHCRDTGWRYFGPNAMDLEPCGCKADLGEAR